MRRSPSRIFHIHRRLEQVGTSSKESTYVDYQGFRCFLETVCKARTSEEINTALGIPFNAQVGGYVDRFILATKKWYRMHPREKRPFMSMHMRKLEDETNLDDTCTKPGVPEKVSHEYNLRYTSERAKHESKTKEDEMAIETKEDEMAIKTREDEMFEFKCFREHKEECLYYKKRERITKDFIEKRINIEQLKESYREFPVPLPDFEYKEEDLISSDMGRLYRRWRMFHRVLWYGPHRFQAFKECRAIHHLNTLRPPGKKYHLNGRSDVPKRLLSLGSPKQGKRVEDEESSKK